MGVSDQDVRSVGVNLAGTQVAGVSTDGDRVLLTEVRDPEADVEPILSGGTDLLPPVWDAADRIWMVNRPAREAQIAVYDDGRLRRSTCPASAARRCRRSWCRETGRG